jgi:hypothetical protein
MHTTRYIGTGWVPLEQRRYCITHRLLRWWQPMKFSIGNVLSPYGFTIAYNAQGLYSIGILHSEGNEGRPATGFRVQDRASSGSFIMSISTPRPPQQPCPFGTIDPRKKPMVSLMVFPNSTSNDPNLANGYHSDR